ncbi:FG-GAP-like repeat-containing protein [Micromonospora rubida]|uniref:FG-GAP-like repeat-containing protein n=1 Tax=Micromonospora rubida TaxID=2697657 RepID=A0ABW7SYH7_9ACTN
MTDRRQQAGAARLAALSIAGTVALAAALAVAMPTQAVAMPTQAVAAPTQALTPTPCDDNGGSRHVTRETALARARSWLSPKVPYSQQHCHRNQYGDYRMDCSGFLAMAWAIGGLGSDWWTGNLHLVTTPVARGSLTLGDALLRHTGDPAENHVALFVRWADSAQTMPVVIEQTGADSVEGTIERTWSSDKASVYTPVRYNGMVDADGISGGLGDVSGDGYADLLATKPDGTLHYYGNNINTNPDNRPYGDGRQIGTGWNGLNRIVSGDVSGDGYADVVGTKPDGTLWYYANNINTNPDNRPYTDGRQIGTGWTLFNRLTLGDVNGDGHADLVATKPDGTLWYYGNNINTNPDNRPYTDGRQIGTGWNQYNRIMAGDVTGDAHADLVATKPDGTLHYYGNNINTNPDNRPYTDGRQIGTGWNGFNRILIGDVTGDAHADLVATKPDGTLHYYGNNINTNPDNRPYTDGRQIGTGWNGFNRIF